MTKDEFLSGVVFTIDRVGENPFCYKFIEFPPNDSALLGDGEILRIAKNQLAKRGKDLIEWDHFANVDHIQEKCFHAYYSLLGSTGHEFVSYAQLKKYE